MRADLPTLRTLWRTRPDNDAAPVVLALCDEIETLRLALDDATRAAGYHERDAAHLRKERYARQVAVTKAARGVIDALHGRETTP